MQETRRFILDILRERGQATVDDIIAELQNRRGKITAVTVRHHLTRLQEEALITSPELRRRSTPGRPQHTYSLTEKAKDHFPNNYQHLATKLIDQLRQQFPPDGVNVIMEGVATCMANDANIPDVPLNERLELVVNYLTEQGYDASWQHDTDGFVLHTNNCPYHQISVSGYPSLCEMDIRLVATLLGVVPRRLSRMSEGDATCSYWIPASE